jgi:hypothetical protein
VKIIILHILVKMLEVNSYLFPTDYPDLLPIMRIIQLYMKDS